MMRTMRCFQTSACHPRNIDDGRRDTQAARLQNAFGVGCGTPPWRQDVLVTGALALVDEARADPPHERVKPEHRADDNLRRREQVVAADDVTHLVGEDRFDVGVAESCGEMPCGQISTGVRMPSTPGSIE